MESRPSTPTRVGSAGRGRGDVESACRASLATRRRQVAIDAEGPTEVPQDATAIGSDFGPFESQQVDLERGAECLLEIWRNTGTDDSVGVPLVIRALGYLSVDSHEFEEWLVCSGVRTTRRAGHRDTCGLTLRQPEFIAQFIEQIFASPGVSPGANRLKAVSQILRYRADATASVLFEKRGNHRNMPQAIRSRIERRASSFAFRWSCLIIVYLFRRQMSILSSSSPPANWR